MQIVEALGQVRVYDSGGQFAYSLHAGQRYLLYDREVGLGLRDEALELIAGIEQRLPAYNREPLDKHRLILPFIGRQGDAIVAASCVAALTERYPEITVDVVCMPQARAVWELMPTFGELLAYPIEAEKLDRYAYHLSFEEVEAIPHGGQRSCADLFSQCLRTPRPVRPAKVIVPHDVRTRWNLPAISGGRQGVRGTSGRSSRPGVAIHVGARGNLRSYPHDLMSELADGLAFAGLEVYLVGRADSRDDATFPVAPGVHDLLGQTPTVADLAAVLEQMQVVVTGDSLPLHLAGALGVTTHSIFTSTDAVIGSDYPSVTAWQSDERCSPCRLADGKCPLGHSECVAHRASSLSPQRIVEHVRPAACAESVG